MSLKSDQILTYSQFIRELHDHSCYNTVANEAFTSLFTMSYRSIGTRFRGGHVTEKCIMRVPKNQDIAEGFDNGICLIDRSGPAFAVAMSQKSVLCVYQKTKILLKDLIMA